MSPILTIQDRSRESRLFRLRAITACGIVSVLALILVARMIVLQVFEHEHFQTLSEDNRVNIFPVPPTRGLIFDRNGVVLAQNTPTYSLEVIAEAVKNLDPLLVELKRVIPFTVADEKRFRDALTRKRHFESVPLRYRLTPEEVARFAVNRHYFPGVDVRARLARNYPHGPLAVHLVGYVGRINEQELRQLDPVNYRATDQIGKTGVERAYEDVLHGTVGYENVETNALGRALRVLDRSDPHPGRNLYLTIDASLQAVAEQALGERRGAVVAIEPATGAVLAFASMPSFDPNLFAYGIDQTNYDRLLGSRDRPLFNRALNGQYPPGSTIKPFLAFAALESKLERAHSHTFCPGWFQLPGREHRYRDWKRGGHGSIDLTGAIVESCDVYFYQLALDLGIERIHQKLVEFGLGRPTGVDLLGESPGLVPSRDWKINARDQPWYPGETLITGIGQGFMLSTPLQLASSTGMLGVRGIRMRPQVILRQIDPRNGDSNDLIPEIVDSIKALDDAHWDVVIDAMENVVHGARGTARRVGVGTTYRIAGKTGTAQVFAIGQDEKYEEDKVDRYLRDHGLFIAFAPASRPRLAVAILVENGGGGSRSAAPIARQVLDQYLQSEDDPLDEDGMLITAFTH